jgi:hypothetical protein
VVVSNINILAINQSGHFESGSERKVRVTCDGNVGVSLNWTNADAGA